MLSGCIYSPVKKYVIFLDSRLQGTKSQQLGFQFPREKEINEWARKKLTANGLSSSRPLKKCKQDTIRHRSCNRRVEFRIQIDESSILRKIIQIFKKVSL